VGGTGLEGAEEGGGGEVVGKVLVLLTFVRKGVLSLLRSEVVRQRWRIK
jgi:hypothetical protein